MMFGYDSTKDGRRVDNAHESPRMTPAWCWHRRGLETDVQHASPWESLHINANADLSEHLRNAKIDALIAKIDRVRSK